MNDMEFLKVMRPEDVQQLVINWQEQHPRKGTPLEMDYKPVCKLFLPWASATWLVTELEQDSSLAFGLADLGLGTPELGYFCLEEIWDVQGPGGIRVEQDLHFKPKMTLRQYATEARKSGSIRA